MDTTIASPGRVSSKIPSLLGIALSVATALWLAAITTQMAQAETPPQPAKAVAYSDLDLSTADGANALLTRIRHAARGVCGPEPVHSPLLPRAGAHYRDCVVASVDAAVERIGSPALLALHRETRSTSSVALAAR
jgi:UrcA family protein